MKKVTKLIAMLIFCAVMFVNVLPVSAMTTQIIITPSYEEDSALSVNFKGGKPMAEYVYTGEVITPELEIRKMDGSIPSPDEYSIEYVFDSDSKSVGAQHVQVTYLKNGYKVILRYDIVPGKTDKIDVKVEDGLVTVSWNPVPGAGAYRVYKYNEETGRYSEMWWSEDAIASASTSRTFTEEELKVGEKYKMGIMALGNAEWMPTDQMAYFTVDTTKDTDVTQKPVSTEKQTQKTEKTTLITPQPTKPGVTSEGVVSTTVKEEVGTTAEEKTTIEENTTAEIKSTVDTLANAEADDDNVSEEKAPIDRTKLVLIICVSLLAIVGIVFTIYKKKR
ncbi:MAG: hypothetical protein IJF20_00250 [Clostridia bacterium]|nr:hypothetical protein [Clostridia bacterium]